MDRGFMDDLPDYEPTDGEMRRVSLNEAMTHRLKSCEECGKVFACYPEIHGWRVKNKLYCSYTCMRIVERREGIRDSEAEERRKAKRRETKLKDTELRLKECEDKIAEYDRKRRYGKAGERRQAYRAILKWQKERERTINKYEELLTQR